MSKNVSTAKIYKCQPIENKWDYVIQSAEDELEDMRKRSYRLRRAVEIFKANKRDGVPWPGEQQAALHEAAAAVTESQKAPACAGAEMGEK